MAVKIGINGFGRIGRLVARIALEDNDVELVAVNDWGQIEAVAHLLKYDSVHGPLNKTVEIDGIDLIIDGKRVKGISTRNPQELNWGELGVDVVIESTGRFKKREECQAHLDAGAQKVVLTCPGKEMDATIVMGVNDEIYDPSLHHIVSNASCTTNCLAPVAKVLNEVFGIERGSMTTVHAYTNDQKILDLKHKDLRRSRAAALSIIPTTTGAAKAISQVIPELTGKLDGMAMRVPVPTGSIVDLTAQLSRSVTIEEVNAALKEASQTSLKGILDYCTDPIVSADVVGTRASSVVDSLLTAVHGESSDFVKVVAWYDNEFGYSCRVVDLAKHIAR